MLVLQTKSDAKGRFAEFCILALETEVCSKATF